MPKAISWYRLDSGLGNALLQNAPPCGQHCEQSCSRASWHTKPATEPALHRIFSCASSFPSFTAKRFWFCPRTLKTGFCAQRTKIATIAVASDFRSALMEPDRQNSRRNNGFWAWKSQLEIANRYRYSIAALNRNAALLILSQTSLAVSGVRDGHRNRKYRCDFGSLSFLRQTLVCMPQTLVQKRSDRKFRLQNFVGARHNSRSHSQPYCCNRGALRDGYELVLSCLFPSKRKTMGSQNLAPTPPGRNYCIKEFAEFWFYVMAGTWLPFFSKSLHFEFENN